MKIRHINGAVADVDDEYGQALVATGTWAVAQAPKQARHRRAAAPKPAPEPTPEVPAEQ